jgi:hypothetical protein
MYIMKYPQKPPDMSDEKWEEEYLYPLAEKKVDNSDHSSPQFRLYSTMNKARKAIIVIAILAIGSVALINPELLAQTVGGLVLIYGLYEITLNDETWSIWDIGDDNDKKNN